jgi:hypothetical protein
MRRLSTVALLALALLVSARERASAQPAPTPTPSYAATSAAGLSAAAGITIGSVAAAAVAPMIGSAIAGRELTVGEVWHIEMSLFLGPVGWAIADRWFPPGREPPHGHKLPPGQQGRGGNISVPPAGATDFVTNEVLVEFRAGASPQQRDLVTSRLQLTQL